MFLQNFAANFLFFYGFLHKKRWKWLSIQWEKPNCIKLSIKNQRSEEYFMIPILQNDCPKFKFLHDFRGFFSAWDYNFYSPKTCIPVVSRDYSKKWQRRPSYTQPSIYNLCCVFRLAFRCCAYQKAGQTPLFQPFSPFSFILNLFQWFHAWNQQKLSKKVFFCLTSVHHNNKNTYTIKLFHSLLWLLFGNSWKED